MRKTRRVDDTVEFFTSADGRFIVPSDITVLVIAE